MGETIEATAPKSRVFTSFDHCASPEILIYSVLDFSDPAHQISDFHRMIWKAFPEFGEGDDRPYLYRVINGSQALVQSTVMPKPNEFITVIDQELVFPKKYKSVTGNMLANVTRRIYPDGRKYRSLKIQGELRDWLERQFGDSVDIARFSANYLGRCQIQHKNNLVTYHQTIFDCDLDILDPDGFSKRLFQGMGQSKFLGLGLFKITGGKRI